ncbi:acetyl-CoA carboxylase carboxyltransferase subunit alpha [Acetanaerobacterium elongatum]|uniref:Acetyl-coenzyme A carboxylase carboxyl transferase subunit alpha n=1 Tax=Acetanaerobacterium elongatum TaxID=258515 RepID=A0A1H0EJA4_9FIRM|nr:acetyl-CoA carboxylase carboxyltransferase subunit alpha [Acetanaerobacterium elongatum]SDN82433.1 acetyl-CoA carboxylase carboxyl transferase subunit alpha [Acetanaerobacterium elongatum]
MSKLTAWERIEIVRTPGRPTVKDYIPMIFDSFIECHGDRLYSDDEAVIGGIARLNGRPVTVIGQVKGKNLEENKKSNFAMAHPEGYRKALRLAKQAEKFKRPVIFFIDTPGAFCGVGAEERGQGEAIARNLYELSTLATPIVSVVLGEGGSGGALALGVCDELAVLENAVYSVISPRGFASILWKDSTKEREAANILKITAEDLLRLGICENIIREPEGGAHNNPQQTAQNIKNYLEKSLKNFSEISIDSLLTNRYYKYRKIGECTE